MRIVLAITLQATALHVGALERRDAKVVSGFSRDDEVSKRWEELAKCLYGKSASSAQSADQKSAGCCPQIAQMTQISAQPIASTARSLGTTARRLKTTFITLLQTHRKPSPVSLAQVPAHLDRIPPSSLRAPVMFSSPAKHSRESARTFSILHRITSRRHITFSRFAKTFSERRMISPSGSKTLGGWPESLAHTHKNYPVITSTTKQHQ